MPRKQRNRKIYCPPKLKGLKPIGIRMRNLKPVSLQYDEYEAIKLCDYESKTHLEASKKLNVSRSTFTRIYENARKKIAKALVEVKPIIIEGGNVEFEKQWYRCNDCNDVYEEIDNEICPNCNSSDNIENINEKLKNWKE